jgi:hypothetical protein
VRRLEQNRDRRIERRRKLGPPLHKPLEEARTHHIRACPVYDRAERRGLIVIPAQHHMPHPKCRQCHRSAHPLGRHRHVRDHRQRLEFGEQSPECPDVGMPQRLGIHDDDIDRARPDHDPQIGHTRDIVNRMTSTGQHAEPR